MDRAAPISLPAFRWVCSSLAGCCSISSCSCREETLASDFTSPLQRPLPDGIISEQEITRSENRWVAVMLAMLALMMAVIVVTGVTHALHPPSNVETIDPTTLHLNGEFVESNLGTAVEPDGSVTVRIVAEQYA